ncbi:family 1 glycosylhydrolase [Mesorhizobium sp. M00.F.Ca.ET.216.01.1.1]|uniref:family 1 glycosylhydrolase n=1 Tax=Mesorhizobium sp. M00.F.Ca.ET.216.01.1.1 TaxID=2500528 RepID=UPI000FD9896A|nr:family 1 glycosylhydrolase [Mesorhizobium sp. M00.F.Ca.ET.216.01.1.1]TGQ35673.1 glycosyl hydrolase family protein [Mesorhizobium sp. M00.F.Ca.ET.216.01.1.1]
MVEIWGGVECSVVRVGDVVRDQLVETGHSVRSEDLDLVASLGIKTLRYPALWEHVEAADGARDWAWLDERLERLREIGISPVAGLLHHGSGPSWTNILASDFAEHLAAFAGRLARRYPWIKTFTPINEPLTTARLSGLYGFWQPHCADEATCFRLLVAQCRAIVKAMAAIRKVIPEARLLQTEDVGRIFATRELQYQADYENGRRWLSLDLLCGHVDAGHPFYERLLGAGVDPVHLTEFEAAPCRPDLIGVDYYLTSDRFLDHRVEKHGAEPVGGNGIEPYVDIAAFRAGLPAHELGFAPRLREVWARYNLPLVVGEVHNACTREEQLRWFIEGWQAAKECIAAGVDVRAVTAWSLFGAVDWNSMMMRADGYYECGVFDARAEKPRRTILADAISALVNGQSFDHPVLEQNGWWRAPRKDLRQSPTIRLRGFDRRLSILGECCSRRRLPATATHVLESGDAWVELSVGTARHGALIVLYAHHAEGLTLSLELSDISDWIAACNAFLDLVVDGLTGHFELVAVDHDNQYRVAERTSREHDAAMAL